MTPEWFQPFVNETFVLECACEGVAVEARLREVDVRPDPHAVRRESAPFVLLFETPRTLPQGRYRVTAPDGRAADIFMTPVLIGRPGSFLEAVFN